MLYELLNALKYLMGFNTLILRHRNLLWKISLSDDLFLSDIAKKGNIIDKKI